MAPIFGLHAALISMPPDSTASQHAASVINRAAPLLRGTRTYRLASLALFLAGFATFSQLYCVQPLLPIFSHEFMVSPTESSFALSLSTGFLAVAVFFAAPVSELFGRRGLMFTSMLLAAVLNLAAAVSPNWHLLLVFRAVEGIVLGGVPAVAMAYLAEEMDLSGLGFAMGLYIAGTAFGGMAGRVLTGAIAEMTSWRTALGFIGISGLLAAAGFFFWLPPSRNFVRQSGLDRRFHIRAWGGHLRSRALSLLFLTAFLSMGSFVAAYNFIGFRLTAPPYSLNQKQLGMVFTVYIFGILSSSIAGPLTERIDRRWVMPMATILTACGVLLTLASGLPTIVVGIVLFTSSFFVVHSVASAWVGQLARGFKGHASSLYLLGYYLGSSAMGSAGGWFYAHGGWPWLVGFVTVLLSLALLAGLTLTRLVPARRPLSS